MAWTRWRTGWGIFVLLAVALAGCGTPDTPTVRAAPRAGSPTGVANPARVARPTSIGLTPSAAPTVTPRSAATQTEAAPPTPSVTPAPRAEVELKLLDCLRKFCTPEGLEQQVRGARDEPGIVLVELLGELHARVIYDPTLLTEEQAARAFARATRMEVEIER